MKALSWSVPTSEAAAFVKSCIPDSTLPSPLLRKA
jgi:hypothetical protein